MLQARSHAMSTRAHATGNATWMRVEAFTIFSFFTTRQWKLKLVLLIFSCVFCVFFFCSLVFFSHLLYASLVANVQVHLRKVVNGIEFQRNGQERIFICLSSAQIVFIRIWLIGINAMRSEWRVSYCLEIDIMFQMTQSYYVIAAK